MPSLEEERVTVEDEDPQKLVVGRKKFWTNLVTIGVVLSLIFVSLLCSFLIPGLSRHAQDTLWQFAAVVFIVTAIFIGMNLEEFGLSCPQTAEEPKPLTGFELC